MQYKTRNPSRERCEKRDLMQSFANAFEIIVLIDTVAAATVVFFLFRTSKCAKGNLDNGEFSFFP